MRSVLPGSLGLFLALVTTSCGTMPRSVPALGVLDAAPDDPNKGYVEFMTVEKNLPFPIFQLDDRRQAYVLAGVGLQAGERYDYRRYRMPVVENLRVAAPAGTHRFVIEQHGQPMDVPVEPGRITPVELNYVLVQAGDFYKVYRLDVRLFKPVPYQPARLTVRTPHQPDFSLRPI